jgi:hypothetical protein
VTTSTPVTVQTGAGDVSGNDNTDTSGDTSSGFDFSSFVGG